MLTDSRKRAARTDFWIAAVLIAGGLVVSGFSLAQLAVGNRDGMTMAQSQAAPPASDKPAEVKPGGTRAGLNRNRSPGSGGVKTTRFAAPFQSSSSTS